ncbi:MAG: hypothetical protein Q9187_000096 [Circinaria calcarea]
MRSESSEPSFLRKLKSQYAGADSSRHERPSARPRKQRDSEGDDEPMYVDEYGRDTITKAEYDAMLNGEGHTKEDVVEQTSATTENPQESVEENEQAVRKPVIAAIGALGKRRRGKVVGKGDEVTDEVKVSTTIGKKRPLKKAKKVNLSYDEEAAFS